MTNRATLIEQARNKVASRTAPRATSVELLRGVPLFLDQLAVRLRAQEGVGSDGFESIATLRGSEALHAGLTIGQVVHGYGDICQVITELATERGVQISSRDFQKLNLCLDIAIAESVSEYARLREQVVAGQGVEHLGFLAHELRNFLNAATLAFEAVRSGRLGIGGSTGKLLGTSLVAMSELIARSLAQVRLESGQLRTERIVLAPLIEEIEIAAIAHASARGIRLTMASGPVGTAVDGDALILRSILSNLVQNACKFTPPPGQVGLHVRVAGDRVIVEVEDECGGLPSGAADRMFEPYAQHGADRSGVGLGLAISLQGARALGGELRVRDLPGHGCVFSLELRGSLT
ncbi:MAG: HAMP domain-containing histidine kinase [Myxococcales bacterium]|nr:HAMP domain-containing histidine kinase [Myxococcales bacterium]